MKIKYVTLVFFIAQIITLSHTASAEDTKELAKKLANPIAALISVPIQTNYDENMGKDDDGSQWVTNIQPVIPFSISEDWNMISRTILPLIDQDNLPVKGSGESGVGDIVQSLFFSPKAPTANGFIWGVGPVLLLDSASDDALGSEKWGIGPTAVVLKQQGSLTYGMLANHIESFAGDDDRADISATFLQPFVSYVTKTKTTFSLNTESTYDWEDKEWSVPVNAQISQMFKVGKQIMQASIGARYWVDSPAAAPEDWGFRFQLTLLFPK